MKFDINKYIEESREDGFRTYRGIYTEKHKHLGLGSISLSTAPELGFYIGTFQTLAKKRTRNTDVNVFIDELGQMSLKVRGRKNLSEDMFNQMCKIYSVWVITAYKLGYICLEEGDSTLE